MLTSSKSNQWRAQRYESQREVGDITYLTLSRQEIDHLLNGTSAVHVERNRNKIASHGFADEVALVVGGILEQLLAEVIAKGIYHKFRIVLGINQGAPYLSSNQRSG